MNYVEINEEIETLGKYREKYPQEIHVEYQGPEFSKTKNALEKALDIRKFEIELYWKRAGYFWTFIALVFTSYFVILVNDKILEDVKDELTLLLSGLGMFLSLCWFFVNKASKYWQENWEKHVDLLEDDIIGPLYKTTLKYKPKRFDFISPIRPYFYSVTKINQLLSFVIVLIWLYIFISNISRINNLYEPFEHFNILIMSIMLILMLLALFFSCKSSDKNGDDFKMVRRKLEQ